MEAEYGSFGNVNFLKPENVKMYDSEGNVILCDCGKPAVTGVIGKDSFASWCSECSPMTRYPSDIVFKSRP